MTSGCCFLKRAVRLIWLVWRYVFPVCCPCICHEVPLFQAINCSARQARARHGPPELCSLPFAGYHFVTTLDFLQHEPINGHPLFHLRARTKEQLRRAEVGYMAQSVKGHRLWSQIKSVVILTEQFRFRSVGRLG